jgi:hypothetical protein
MRDLGVIKSDDPTRMITLDRLKACVSNKPQCVPELRGVREDWGCWRIMDGDACVGRLDWDQEYRRPGRPGYVVVSAEQLDSQAVTLLAESLADALGATFQRRSARFTEIEEMAERFSNQHVEIEFDDGDTRLVELDYCSLQGNEERLYFYTIGGGGLCFTRIGEIRSIRTSATRPPDPRSNGSRPAASGRRLRQSRRRRRRGGHLAAAKRWVTAFQLTTFHQAST